jgi:outer membrane protein TolC
MSGGIGSTVSRLTILDSAPNSMKNTFRLTLAVPLILNAWTISAQVQPAPLTLQECIRLARANGPLGVMAQSTFQSRRSSYLSFTATSYPQLSLQGDVPGYYRSINPIVLPDGSTIFSAQRQASSSLNLGLTQRIPLTGGQMTLLSGVNRIDLIDSRTQYYRSRPLTLTLNQPLFQINTMKWDQEVQDLNYGMASRALAEAMEDCALDVTNKFFDLYLAEMNSSNAAVNLAINDTLYRISRGRFNVGKIAENDLLQSELAYLNSQTQLENANVGLHRSEQNLKVALGLPPATPIVLQPPTEIPAARIDPEFALAQARGNRSDVLGFDLQLLTAERNVRQARSDNSFNATMTASIGYNQQAPVIPDAYRNLLDQEQFSVGFTIPLFRWGAGSSAVDAALADQRRADASVGQQRHDFEQEVLYQAAHLNLLRAQVAVAEKSDTIAQRRFDVAKDRYVIGKIDIPILFIAQSEKDNARRANVQTLWDYWSTFFRVRRLTLFDFETGAALSGGESNR